jgi:DNA-binding protein H-NS
VTTTADLQTFSIEELEQLIGDAKSLLSIRVAERKAQAMAQARDILEAAGVSPRELARTKLADKKPALNVKQGCKYTNPNNPDECWIAGKGRRPKWVADLGARGLQPIEVMP